jgi:hypothetical protein
MRGHVDVALDRESHLRRAGRTHMAAGHGVGIDAQHLDRAIRHTISPGELGIAAVKRRHGNEAGIGAGVEDHPRLDREQPCVGGDAGAQRDAGGMARVPRRQFLERIHHHLDRPAGGTRQVAAKERVHQRSLAAKIAADRDGIEPDAMLRHADGRRHMSARDMKAFIGDPHIDEPVRADRDEAGMRLDIALMHRGNGEVMFKDLMRRREGVRDIAMPHLELRDHVRNRRIHTELAVASGRRPRQDLDCFRMDDGRRRPHRVLGAEDSRQLRILDIHEFERGLRDLDGIGRDRRHFLADEARHALGEQWNILAHTAIACIGHIAAGQHGMNAGERLGAPHIDRDDAGAGMRAAQATAEEHACSSTSPA